MSDFFVDRDELDGITGMNDVDETLDAKLKAQQEQKKFYNSLPEETKKLLDKVSELQAKMKKPAKPKKEWSSFIAPHEYYQVRFVDMSFDNIPMTYVAELPPPTILSDAEIEQLVNNLRNPVRKRPKNNKAMAQKRLERGWSTSLEDYRHQPSELAERYLTHEGWLKFLEQPLPLKEYLIELGFGEDLKRDKEEERKKLDVFFDNKAQLAKQQGLDKRFESKRI